MKNPVTALSNAVINVLNILVVAVTALSVVVVNGRRETGNIA